MLYVIGCFNLIVLIIFVIKFWCFVFFIRYLIFFFCFIENFIVFDFFCLEVVRWEKKFCICVLVSYFVWLNCFLLEGVVVVFIFFLIWIGFVLWLVCLLILNLVVRYFLILWENWMEFVWVLFSVYFICRVFLLVDDLDVNINGVDFFIVIFIDVNFVV